MPHRLPSRVPPGSAHALEVFAKLPAKVRAALLKEFRDERPPFTTPRGLIERLGGLVPVDEGLIGRFTSALFSMGSLGSSHGWSEEDVASIVVGAQDLDLTATQRGHLQTIVLAALRSPAFAGLAKAVDVGAEHERLYHVSRILTDLRPVFRDADDGPVGLVLTHKLRVDFYANGDMTSIELALTEEDVTNLSETVERARHKAASLKAALSKADLTLFDLSEG